MPSSPLLVSPQATVENLVMMCEYSDFSCIVLSLALMPLSSNLNTCFDFAVSFELGGCKVPKNKKLIDFCNM